MYLLDGHLVNNSRDISGVRGGKRVRKRKLAARCTTNNSDHVMPTLCGTNRTVTMSPSSSHELSRPETVATSSAMTLSTCNNTATLEQYQQDLLSLAGIYVKYCILTL